MSRALQAATLGIALCLLAAAFGVPGLYVPGVALALVATSAETIVRLATWRGRVTREPRVARIEEGSSLRLSVRVDLWLPLRCELSGWPGAPFKPLPALRRAPVELTARALRRGAHVIGPVEIRLRDPFSICTRLLRSNPSQVLVLPRVEHVPSRDLARVSGLARTTRPGTSDASGTDVDGLRPYRHGAPASRIHWPTVARTRTLVERRLQDEAEGLPVVVLDASAPASDERLDMAVRAAASLCVALARLGGCVLLLPGDARTRRLGSDLTGWPELHERLALVEPGQALGRGHFEAAPALLWVTAGSRQPRALTLSGLRYTVSPVAFAGRSVLFTVAGCAVQPAARALTARAA